MDDSLDEEIFASNKVLCGVAVDPTISSLYPPFPKPPFSLVSEYPPLSLVTPDQYAQADIRKKVDDSANMYQQPDPTLEVSFRYPTAQPYVCPCSNEGCMMQFDRIQEALAECLNHAPGMHGRKVQLMVPVWTASNPQHVEYKPDGPAIKIGQPWWPKAERFGIPWKPMPRIKDMAAQASTPEGIQELEALYAEADSWAGKQSQGGGCNSQKWSSLSIWTVLVVSSTNSTCLFRSSCTNSEDWKSPVLCSVDAAYCQVTDAIGSMSSLDMSLLSALTTTLQDNVYMAEVRSIGQGLLWTLQFLFAGSSHVFSKFCLDDYRARNFDVDVIRSFPCPAVGCTAKLHRPTSVLKHTRREHKDESELSEASKHATYVSQEFCFYRLLFRADGHPDFVPCQYNGAHAAAKVVHISKSTEQAQQSISGEKRARKPTERYQPEATQAKHSKTTVTSSSNQTEVLQMVQGVFQTAMDTKVEAVKQVCEMKMEMQMRDSANKDLVHALELAAAKKDGEHKALEAKHAAAAEVTALYKGISQPLVNKLLSSSEVSAFLKS